jgi:hypothetical protein
MDCLNNKLVWYSDFIIPLLDRSRHFSDELFNVSVQFVFFFRTSEKDSPPGQEGWQAGAQRQPAGVVESKNIFLVLKIVFSYHLSVMS